MMKRVIGKCNRVLSAILAAAMLFTSVPVSSMTAYAAEESVYDVDVADTQTNDTALNDEANAEDAASESGDDGMQNEDTDGSADENGPVYDDGSANTDEPVLDEDASVDIIEEEPAPADSPIREGENADILDEEISLASDDDVTAESDFEWDEDGTTIIGYTGSDKNVVIPATATAIGESAFESNETIRTLSFAGDEILIHEHAFAETFLRSITLPGGTTFADDGQFYNCQYLSSVTLEEGIKEIPEEAFLYTIRLTDIVIPSSVEEIGGSAFAYSGLTALPYISGDVVLGDAVFAHCESLTEVSLEQFHELAPGMFMHCTKLSAVSLSDGLEVIYDQAFYDCPALTEITLPNSVQELGIGTFEGTGITRIVIPASVTDSPILAFNNCSELTCIEYAEGRTEIPKWDLGENGSPVDTVVFPSTITTIAEGAFENFTALTEVNLSNSQVQAIGDGTFKECTALTTIELPNTLTTIGQRAFYGCTSLAAIDVPDNVTEIGLRAFEGCQSLTSITLSDSLMTIGDYAFHACKSLTRVVIPGSVTTVGKYIFWECTALDYLEYGEGMTTIPFVDAEYAGTVVLPTTAKTIEERAFYKYTRLTTINLPEGLATIGDYAFYNCTSLSRIVIPGSVTDIGDYVLYGCTSLDYLEYGEGMMTIPRVYAYQVSTVVLPTTARTIEKYAFYGYTDLATINLPDGINTIEERAFYNCTNLTTIDLPNSIKTIGDYAFYGCTSLSRIVIPGSVTDIGDYVLYGCTSLDYLEYGEGMTTIPRVYAYQVSTVVLPSTTEVIGEYAFCGYANLTTINMPASIKTIEAYAFGFQSSSGSETYVGPSQMTELRFEGDGIIAIDDQAFNGSHNSTEIPVYCPLGSEVYQYFANREGFKVIAEGAAYHSIQYVLNGGTNAEGNPTSYRYGDDLVIQDPTREEFVFRGWYTDSDLSRVFVYDKETTDADLVLYAAWEEIGYEITYDLDGGLLPDGAMNPTTYVPSEDVILAAPTKDYAAFGGWKVNDTDVVITDNRIAAGSYAEDLHLTAQWLEPSYQIIWNKNAKDATGSMETTTLRVNDVYELPGDGYTRVGYDLASWNTKANGKGTSYAVGETVRALATTEGAQVTLYAQWQKSLYEIVYDLNDSETSPATNNKSNPDSYTIGQKVTLKAPTRTGYIFGGWYEDAAFTTKVTTITSAMGDVTIYAQWTPITYTITFNKNKGTLPAGAAMDTITAQYDELVTLPENAFVRTGYTFLGWDLTANSKAENPAYGKDVLEVSNLSSKNKGKVTLYARWQVNQIPITYVLNDSDKDPATNAAKNPAYVTIEKNVVLSAPTRAGYTFKGWYTDEGLTTALARNTISKTTTEPVTVYAAWAPITYTLKLDKNGGTYTIPAGIAGKYAFTDSVVLPDGDGALRTNYELTGWNTKKDRTGTHYGLGETVSGLAAKGTVTLYAEWTPVADKVYTITYHNVDEWDNSKNPETYSFEKDVKLVSPTRTGYTFKGWYAEDPTVNTKAKKVTTISKKSIGDMDLYGVWSENSYTIAYNANKGTLPKGSKMTAQTVLYSDEVNLTANVYTRKGYGFAGWNTKANGSGIGYADAESVSGLVSKAKGKVTLYAQWDAIDYKITYVNVGLPSDTAENSVDNPNPATYTIVKDVKLADPSLYGYTFKGWYGVDPEVNPKAKKVTKIAKTTAADTTVYAQWTENRYSLRFSGGSVKSITNRLYTDELTIPSTVPTKDGYTFQGWALTRNGSVVCQPGDSISFEELHAAGGIARGVIGTKYMTLYAIFWPNT